MRWRLSIVLLMLLLASCTSTVSTVGSTVNPPTATAATTETPTPTASPTLTSTSFPTRQPYPTRTLSPTPAPVDERDPINDVPTKYPAGVIPLMAHQRIGIGNIWGNVEVSPDQRRFAVATTSGVYVFDSQTEDLLWSAATQSVLSSLTWSPFGDKLAVKSVYTEAILVWDAGGQFITRFEKDDLGSVLGWSPDGKQIAAEQLWVDQSEQIHSAIIIWDIDTGDEVGFYELDMGEDVSVYLSYIKDLQWSPRYIAINTLDRKMLILDLVAGTFQGLEAPDDDSYERAEPLAFSPDGSKLVSIAVWPVEGWGFFTWYVVIRDMDSFEILNRFNDDDRLPGGDHWLVVDAVWSPDGKYVAASHNSSLIILNAATGEEIFRYQTDKYYFKWLAWSPDGTTLSATTSSAIEAGPGSTTLTSRGALLIVDLTDSDRITIEVESARSFNRVAWLSNKKLILSFLGQDLYVRDISTHQYTAILKGGRSVVQLAHSPDSLAFAAVQSYGDDYPNLEFATYWNYQTWEPLGSPQANLPPTDWIYSPRAYLDDPQELAVPADLTYILDRTPDHSGQFGPNRITLMDGNRTILDYIDYELVVHSSAISLDGKYLAFGFGPYFCQGCSSTTTLEQAYILLFDTETETYVTLYGHTGKVTSLLFLPDGDLISGSTDGTIIVWDIP